MLDAHESGIRGFWWALHDSDAKIFLPGVDVANLLIADASLRRPFDCRQHIGGADVRRDLRRILSGGT